MQNDHSNIYRQSYEDETINPLHLFQISTKKLTRYRNQENLDQNAINSSSYTSNFHSRTENNTIPRYRTLTQQSLTEQSMNDQKNLCQKNDRSSSINFDTERINKGGLKCQLGKKRKERNPQLKQIIRRHKIRNIVESFINKIKRNNPFAAVVQMEDLEQQRQGLQWFNISGIDINESVKRALDIVLLSINFICIYYYTLGLAFSIHGLSWAIYFERWVLFAFVIDFLLASLTTRYISGKRIIKLKEIIGSYLDESMLIDIWMIIVLIIDAFYDENAIRYMKLIVILKLPYLLEKMQKLQIYLIATTYKEQYWSLIKLFLFNFCFAHILALTLRSIANINPAQNWMITKNIANAQWFEGYIWSYYWAINIMLTVGFGDIVATNYQQALCLIFIETFSCMALAYNINCVGTLISNIRSQDLEKSKKYKIFRSLAEKHNISNELSLRIGNYIEESNNIKKKFNIQEENKFIDALPKIYKKDYLKQANKSIFQKIFFFTSLADKAIQALAQSIQVNITHPEQLITNTENYMSLKILKEGQMGYCCRKMGSTYNGYVIDQISVSEGQSPFLLGVEFITHRRPTFEIKSMQYSIIYGLAYDKLIQSLRKSRGDYEYLCFLRDKSKYLIDQFEINKCLHCKTKHTRFMCPKLHYIPIKQQVINRALYNQKISKCQRINMERISFRRYNALTNFQSINQIPLNKNLTCSTVSKNKIFLIEQLRKIERINTQLTHQRTNFDYPMVFFSNAAESIKQQISNFLRRQNEEDEIWTIALDSMQNYKNYFPNDNPGELENRFGYDQKPMFVALGFSHKNQFIVYHHQKERTLKQGTYIQRLEHALDSESIPFSSFQQY